MLKARNISKYINLPIFLLFLGALYSLIYGLGLVLESQIINFLIIPAIIALTVADFRRKKHSTHSRIKALYLFSPGISIGFIAIKLAATITDTLSYGVLTVVALVCGLALFFLYVGKGAAKYALGVLYVIIAIPIVLFVGIVIYLSAVFMPSGGVETARVSVMSPNGLYLVEAVQRSQSALGGDTSVTITPQRLNTDLLIVEIRHRPVHIHGGRYSEFYHNRGLELARRQ